MYIIVSIKLYNFTILRLVVFCFKKIIATSTHMDLSFTDTTLVRREFYESAHVLVFVRIYSNMYVS